MFSGLAAGTAAKTGRRAGAAANPPNAESADSPRSAHKSRRLRSEVA